MPGKSWGNVVTWDSAGLRTAGLSGALGRQQTEDVESLRQTDARSPRDLRAMLRFWDQNLKDLKACLRN